MMILHSPNTNEKYKNESQTGLHCKMCFDKGRQYLDVILLSADGFLVPSQQQIFLLGCECLRDGTSTRVEFLSHWSHLPKGFPPILTPSTPPQSQPLTQQVNPPQERGRSVVWWYFFAVEILSYFFCHIQNIEARIKENAGNARDCCLIPQRLQFSHQLRFLPLLRSSWQLPPLVTGMVSGKKMMPVWEGICWECAIITSICITSPWFR